MKVQKIEQSVDTDSLVSRGNINGSDKEKPISLFGREISIPGKEEIDTGIFECTAGSYRRMVKKAEVMHILAGKGSFTEDGKETVFFKPGDTLFFAENTEGEWVVEETMRKVYVILP